MKKLQSKVGFKLSKGFTLLELIIVMAILSVTATFFVIKFPSSQERARDSQRINDLKQYQSALEIFSVKNNGNYPVYNGNAYDICDDLGLGTTCSKDPKDAMNSCSGALCGYKYVSDGSKYVLYATRERSNSANNYIAVCSNGLTGEAASAPSSEICPVSTCSGGYTLCGSNCVDLASDINNCGSCGNVCSSGYTCSSGVCAIISCPAGFDKCFDGCKNLDTDEDNCGSCGNVCPAGNPSCCSGTCKNLNTDLNNCGSCGNVCSSGYTCSSGKCVISCPKGFDNCSGVCKNLDTDEDNCGSCGSACNSGDSCVLGSCISACKTPCGKLCCDSSYCSTGTHAICWGMACMCVSDS